MVRTEQGHEIGDGNGGGEGEGKQRKRSDKLMMKSTRSSGRRWSGNDSAGVGPPDWEKESGGDRTS